MSLHRLTIHELREMLDGRQVSAVELTRDVLQRIEKVEDRVKAYITLDPEGALKRAEASDAELKKGTG
ncbi:MAG: amidase family protein, partial [Desulfobulbaceae bacterium]|nr:amidase family protein [Desulfobulbaceae bacterium]